MNFYRFCQLLEQSQPDKPVTGSTWQVRHEPVRFRPHPGMGFPASEIKGIEPLSIRICRRRYASPLWGSTAWSRRCRRTISMTLPSGGKGTRPADFLDIFNHRLIAQYYRIWRKYSYPATFEEGGKDKTSQYLLGLAGLGIDGCTDSIAPRPHAFWRCCR
jgi:type VI secretion system protein ImpH